MPGITLILDEVTPLLERLRSETQARGLALVGARAVGTLVKDHLYGLDAQRHRFGRHYYRQAGDSVTTGADPRGAFVAITQLGFRQRLLGGPIAPKSGRYLTIPAAPEAYGKRAGEFNDLDFAIVHDPENGALRPALVRRAQTTIRWRRQKGEGGAVTLHARPVAHLLPEVMFWLVRSVEQQPDPTVLPYDEQMSQTAVDAITRRMQRLAERN